MAASRSASSPRLTTPLQARASVGAESVIDGVAAGRDNVAIVLPSPGSIEGTLAGFRETPRVFALRQDARSSGAVTHGAVSGNAFTMRTVTPGTYLLDARTGTEAASARVEVMAGRTSQVTLSTTGSSGTVTGRVRDFRSGAPVEGMTCVPWPRVGIDRTSGPVGDGVRTDPDGRFELTSVPAGDIAIFCTHDQGNSADAVYTNGVRLVSVAPAQRLEIDVPVVKMSESGFSPASVPTSTTRSSFHASTVCSPAAPPHPPASRTVTWSSPSMAHR